MDSLKRILHLGLKELISLRHDPVLIVFIVYMFTFNILNAADQSVEVRNAAIAVVDEDGSQLSRRIAGAFLAPRFQPPVRISPGQIDRALDSGRFTFVVVIPPRFAARVSAGRQPAVQVNVDATAVGQAFAGAGYIEAIVRQEVGAFYGRPPPAPRGAVKAVVRVMYNSNLAEFWFTSVGELVLMVTVMTMLLPAAALIREQEHGTVGHLLSMPISPAEIVLAKVWSNAVVVQLGCLFCLYAVIQGALGVPLRGSIALFLFGTLIYQFTASAIGMMLATLVRTVPQFVLIMLLVIAPMIFLSGAFTPPESMPPGVQALMTLSPLRYYVDFAYAVLFRDAEIALVAYELGIMTLLGAVLFTVAIARFRAHFSLAGK